MNVYRDGRSVSVDIGLVDENGQDITAQSVSYRVLDGIGTELVALTPIDTFVAGETQVTITVGASINALAAGETRAIRVIELSMVSGTDTIVIFARYVIEGETILAVGTNSVQTYNEALLTSMDMLGLDVWEEATDRQRKIALIESYYAISVYTFVVTMGQDKLFPGEQMVTLHDLSESEIRSLPARLLEALRKGQVAEANDRLGGKNPVAEKRDLGLMSETVGESSNMFRPGKPIEHPIGDAAMRYLGEFIVRGKKLGRG